MWGHLLKSKIYTTPLASLEDLGQRITHDCREITPEKLHNVRKRSQKNLYYCKETLK